MWDSQPKRHALATHSIESEIEPFTQQVPMYISPNYSHFVQKGELGDLKRPMVSKIKTIKIDKHTSIVANKPKNKNDVFPVSPEFLAKFIEAFVPIEERKHIKTVYISNLIPNSECELLKCAGEYIPGDEIYFYYTTLNQDGTYGPLHLSREEYVAKILYDVLPHEFGHKADCLRYTKREKKVCVPSHRAERMARAKATAFRKENGIPERWYYLTNKNPSGFISNEQYLRATSQKK